MKPPPKDKKMTTINRILTLNTTIFEDVKVGLKLPSNFTIPSLGSNVLYGSLSDELHIPPGNKVYIAKSKPLAFHEFYETLISALFPAGTMGLIAYDKGLTLLEPVDYYSDSDVDLLLEEPIQHID